MVGMIAIRPEISCSCTRSRSPGGIHICSSSQAKRLLLHYLHNRVQIIMGATQKGDVDPCITYWITPVYDIGGIESHDREFFEKYL